MASYTFIPTSKLSSLLSAADPQNALLVRVLDETRLSIDAANFQRVAIIDLANEKIISEINSTQYPHASVKASRKSGKYQLVAFGRATDYYSLKDLLKYGLEALENSRPGSLEKLSKIKPGTKRIVARTPSDLFDSPGLSNEYSQKLMDGWWYGTNNSKQETNAWLKRACECAGVKWGEDFDTSL